MIVTDDELEAVEPRKTRTIDIESFVDLDEIDPIYFDHPYFLVPAGETRAPLRAYRLLVEVMETTDRVALGRFVLRTKEYLVAIRARDGALTLTTMRFHDEVRSAKDVPSAAGRARSRRRRSSTRRVKLIEAMADDWDPSSYEDRYRKRLQKIVRDKRKGGTIEVPEGARAEPGPPPDLMAALEETLAAATK